MKKRILSVLLCAVMVLSMLTACGGGNNGGGNTEQNGGETTKTIKVAAIETAYGAQMWKDVAAAFEAETGIKVELTIDKNLEDVIGPSMQGGSCPDVVHLATGREAAVAIKSRRTDRPLPFQ